MSTVIESALRKTRERVEEACRRVDRDPAEVRIVAISKTVAVERIRELLAAGQRLLGENRVQEALAKVGEIGSAAEWHLVGNLQKNKARQVVGSFALIHSVDSEKLVCELDRRAAAFGVRQQILVQVNQSGEPTKHGVSERDLPALLDAIVPLEHVELRGLMTIPPPVAVPEDSRVWFRKLRELRDVACHRIARPLPELSMGMSQDFEVAIEEGATLVRIGRAIFGERG